MRLIRITTNYPSYLHIFYNQRPNLKNQPYQFQCQELMADCFGWADFWTNAFRKLGYEVWEPVGNAEPMQKMWAKEHDITYNRESWLTDIITAQVKYFQPEILFVNDYTTFTFDFFQHLKSECSSIKFIMGWCGAPYQDANVFKAYDLVLSNIPNLVEDFRNQGHKSQYMLHAFEPIILDNINTKVNQNIDFSFIGSIYKGKDLHLEREKLLIKLAQNTNLQIWSNVNKITPEKLKFIHSQQKIYAFVKVLEKFPFAQLLTSKLPKISNYTAPKMSDRPKIPDEYIDLKIGEISQPGVYGLSMYQKLFESKITLNNHINISGKYASNMRLYEATGIGTCLLTDWKENLPQIFEPEKEVVTYRTPEECIEKVKWLLAHPTEREAIAKAGQARTLKDHTFEQRAIQLDKIIRKNLI